MYELLTGSVRERVGMSAEEVKSIYRYFIPKKIRKRQFLLNEGDACPHLAFVEKGFLRSYTTQAQGDERVIQFSMENWWVTDMGSFLTGDQAVFSIEAVENCELLLLTLSAMEEMMKTERKMEKYFRVLMQNNIIALQRRILTTMNNTAEEKYLALLASCPGIVHRAAQQDIASFLGITPETLSRIRKQLTQRA